MTVISLHSKTISENKLSGLVDQNGRLKEFRLDVLSFFDSVVPTCNPSQILAVFAMLPLTLNWKYLFLLL